MNEKEFFITSFISNFVASKTALDYDEHCMNGKHDVIEQFGIMEDAIYLADLAWEKYMEHSRKYNRKHEAAK